MKKIMLLAVLVLLLTVNVAEVGAQGNRPPTIFNFASDLATITVPEAEAGTTQATLTWHVAHVNSGHKLLLYVYQLKGWTLLAGEDQVLPPVAGIIVNVTHSGTFTPPTYKLAIVNQEGAVLDERIVIIAYTPNATPPTITSFTTTAQGVDAASLADGSARVQVAWEIADRSPQTNLVFDQLLPDGTEKNVELARDVFWIASKGEGTVAPVDPGQNQPITLRMRLVNVITAEIYDEVLIAVGGPADQNAATTPEAAPAGGAIITPAPQPSATFPAPVETLVPPSPTPLVGG